MLDTPQRYPRAGSQSYPSPAAESNADGSTTVYFGPTQPDCIALAKNKGDHGLKEYKHGATFPGTIGRVVNDSSPAWPEPNRARKGAPNVLFWIIDDVG